MLLEEQRYKMEFTPAEWEELECLNYAGSRPDLREPLLRGQWLAIAQMALGKAQSIIEGHYDDCDGDDNGHHGSWALELRRIAAAILYRLKVR